MNVVEYLGRHVSSTLKEHGVNYPSNRVVRSGRASYAWSPNDLFEITVRDTDHDLFLEFDPDYVEFIESYEGFVFRTGTDDPVAEVIEPDKVAAMAGYMLLLLSEDSDTIRLAPVSIC